MSRRDIRWAADTVESFLTSSFLSRVALVPTLAKPSAGLRLPKHTWRVSSKGGLPSEETLPDDVPISGCGVPSISGMEGARKGC